MVAFTFDATNIEPAGEFTLIPDGVYKAIIVNSEIKPTTKGDGLYLKLDFQLTYGPYKNRLLFTTINFQNPNPKTEEIASAQLSAICHAVGILKITDSKALHSKEMAIKVEIEESVDKNDPNKKYKNNRIKAFYSLAKANEIAKENEQAASYPPLSLGAPMSPSQIALRGEEMPDDEIPF